MSPQQTLFQPSRNILKLTCLTYHTIYNNILLLILLFIFTFIDFVTYFIEACLRQDKFVFSNNNFVHVSPYRRRRCRSCRLQEGSQVRRPSQQLHLPAFETLGPLSSSTTVFLTELGRRLSASTGEPRETAFLFQRLSIAVQWFNAVLIQETFDLSDGQPDL